LGRAESRKETHVSEAKISRRVTLSMFATAPLWVGVLSACGKKTEPDSCTDVSALGDAEKSARSALQYVDRAPDAAKVCVVCQFFQAPSDPAQCGGCQIVKGPIHPKGYCTGFAAKV
jgi:hypothetical protein